MMMEAAGTSATLVKFLSQHMKPCLRTQSSVTAIRNLIKSQKTLLSFITCIN